MYCQTWLVLRFSQEPRVLRVDRRERPSKPAKMLHRLRTKKNRDTVSRGTGMLDTVGAGNFVHDFDLNLDHLSPVGRVVPNSRVPGASLSLSLCGQHRFVVDFFCCVLFTSTLNFHSVLR